MRHRRARGPKRSGVFDLHPVGVQPRETESTRMAIFTITLLMSGGIRAASRADRANGCTALSTRRLPVFQTILCKCPSHVALSAQLNDRRVEGGDRLSEFSGDPLLIRKRCPQTLNDDRLLRD